MRIGAFLLLMGCGQAERQSEPVRAPIVWLSATPAPVSTRSHIEALPSTAATPTAEVSVEVPEAVPFAAEVEDPEPAAAPSVEWKLPEITKTPFPDEMGPEGPKYPLDDIEALRPSYPVSWDACDHAFRFYSSDFHLPYCSVFLEDGKTCANAEVEAQRRRDLAAIGAYCFSFAQSCSQWPGFWQPYRCGKFNTWPFSR